MILQTCLVGSRVLNTQNSSAGILFSLTLLLAAGIIMDNHYDSGSRDFNLAFLHYWLPEWERPKFRILAAGNLILKVSTTSCWDSMHNCTVIIISQYSLYVS